MPSINTSDIIRASDSTYFVDIARVKKFILTYFYNLLFLNPSKTEFLIFRLPRQLSKLNNPTIHLPRNVILSPVDSARNLGVIFEKNVHYIYLLFLNHASTIFTTSDVFVLGYYLSNYCLTIATSLIHSKIDYCNSFLLNLPATQTNRLQLS